MGLFDFLKRNSSKESSQGSSQESGLSKEERYGKLSLKGYQTGVWLPLMAEFQKLEDEGLDEASIALGQFYGMTDRQKALGHFRKGAAKKNAEAAWSCAAIIGFGYKPDFKGADKEWYMYCKQAALGGCSDAMHELGKAYDHLNDYFAAFYWFLMSGYYEHPMGYFDAMQVISKYKDAGMPSVTKGIAEISSEENGYAKIIFEIYTGRKTLDKTLMDTLFARSLGNAEILGLFLGHFFEDSVKMDGNSRLGYQFAAQANSVIGMKCFGDMLAAGKGIEQNVNKAMNWYKSAAECGEKTACFIWAQTFTNNPLLRAYWLSKAMRRGYEPALALLEKIKY